MPYIGRSTDGFGVRNRFLYLASADDTSVSGADANGATLTFTDGAYVDVYLNGVFSHRTSKSILRTLRLRLCSCHARSCEVRPSFCLS